MLNASVLKDGAMTKSAVRSAESDRTSSCKFADRIAQLSLDFYRMQCPTELIEAYKQTVIASVVIQIPNHFCLSLKNGPTSSSSICSQTTLHVLSLGVGTKVLNASKINEEKSNGNDGDRLVRDCHAEVLARRGFLAYLYHELERLRTTQCTDYPSESSAANTPHNSIFEWNPVTNKLRLREGIKLHLYSSSQPCGNASIKKWAKGKAPPTYPHLTDDEYPEETHSRLQVTSKHLGQVALLVKKNNHTVTSASATVESSVDTTTETTQSTTHNIHDNTINATEQMSIPTTADKSNSTTDTSQYEYLPGTAPTNSQMGNVVTCSDKIALWNALGLQGALLSEFYEPLYLSTITVGRKYSKIHGERALCCRLQDFCFPVDNTSVTTNKNKNKKLRVTDSSNTTSTINTSSAKQSAQVPVAEASYSSDILVSVDTTLTTKYRIHHPIMLSTKVKLDEGAIFTGTAATTATISAHVTDSSEVSARLVTKCTESLSSGGVTVEIVAAPVVIVGAQFGETRSLCCWYTGTADCSDSVDSYKLEVIDGQTGLLSAVTGVSNCKADRKSDNTLHCNDSACQISEISSHALYQKYNHIRHAFVHQQSNQARSTSSYAECKKYAGGNRSENRVGEYHAAKKYLQSSEKFFSEWIKKTI